MRTRTRRLTLLATATLAGIIALASPASATTSDAGLFGASDPTYDGVFRQSLAIIGLQQAGATVPPSAISWLLAQQCADGSFMAYRTTEACAESDPVNYTGPDTNSTAMAAMALAAVGKNAAADKAAHALATRRNADGGWGYVFGSPSDANSTGLVLAALDHSSDDEKRAELAGLRYLRGLAGACSKGASSLPYQQGQAANDLASAQALLGLNTGLDFQNSPAKYTKAQKCNEELDQRVAEFLLANLRKGNGLLSSAMSEGKPDYNTTAWSVIGLVGADRPAADLRLPLRKLEAGARTFIGTGTAASPAAAGTLAIVAEHTDADPRDFGGVDLVSTIKGTLRK